MVILNKPNHLETRRYVWLQHMTLPSLRLPRGVRIMWITFAILFCILYCVFCILYLMFCVLLAAWWFKPKERIGLNHPILERRTCQKFMAKTSTQGSVRHNNMCAIRHALQYWCGLLHQKLFFFLVVHCRVAEVAQLSVAESQSTPATLVHCDIHLRCSATLVHCHIDLRCCIKSRNTQEVQTKNTISLMNTSNSIHWLKSKLSNKPKGSYQNRKSWSSL